MDIYTVGGAVRDELLGLPVKDHDYVVVGATPEALIAEGFRPVGKDFPVFLHPDTHEEYALARTERKTASGYKGFQVYAAADVTLEDDLARRDLTMNAIALSADGVLIDPYGGQADIEAKVLRHVSPAFVEDPVRILRVARFAARFDGFVVAAETNALMRKMVDTGEVDSLVPERVWQEISRGLMESKPSRMFQVLRDCGALKKILPEVDKLFGVPQPSQHHPEVDTGVHVMMVIDYAASKNFELAVRFAALTHDLGKGETPVDLLPRHIGHEQKSVELVTKLCQRIRVPNDCRELGLMVARLHGKAHQALVMRPDTMLQMLIETDAIRQPSRFEQFLQACESDARGRTGFEAVELPQLEQLRSAMQAVCTVNSGKIASQYQRVEEIKQAIYESRLAALKALIRK